MKALHKLLSFALDILLAAVLLLGFAYIHHGRAFLRGETAVDPSSAVVLPSAAVSAPVDFRFADKFTDGGTEQTDNSYKSANVNVSWTRHEDTSGGHKVVYYIADVYLRSPGCLHTAIPEHGFQEAQTLAAQNGAILAINGNYALARTQGPIVRNGMLMRDNSLGDVLVFYESGEMKTFSADGFDLETESSKGILDVWSFGPALLDSDGKSISGFTDTVAGANPRSAIGYYEPGHYCFVAVDGRNAEGSSGYTLDELSKLFEDLGCTVAYNLDGGQSSVMVWDGGSVTVIMPAGGGRPVGDIIYISKE